MSRIEQLIDEIEEFIESCKPQAFSQTKVIVPKDELYELLTELRLKTPEEIKRYQKIIANRDKIISDAQAQAEKMVQETVEYTNALVEEHEIMLKAYERAEEVLNAANAQAEATVAEANQNAEEVRMGALEYTKNMISEVETTIASAVSIAKTNSEGFIGGLSNNLEILKGNREALEQQMQDANTAVPAPQPAEAPVHEETPELEEAFEEDTYIEEENEDEKTSLKSFFKKATARHDEDEDLDDDDLYEDDDYEDID